VRERRREEESRVLDALPAPGEVERERRVERGPEHASRRVGGRESEGRRRRRGRREERRDGE